MQYLLLLSIRFDSGKLGSSELDILLCFIRGLSGTSFVDLLWVFFCLVLLCLCARLFICALWSPAGKGLTSWLSFVVSNCDLSLFLWYPGSGVVLDCIDS